MNVEQRTQESRRSWRGHASPHHALESIQHNNTNESPLRMLLRECLHTDSTNPCWKNLEDHLLTNPSPIDLTQDEPGIVLIEQLAANAKPSDLLALFNHFQSPTQDLFIERWSVLLNALPLELSLPSAPYQAAAQAYVSFRAKRVAELLKEQFIEIGDNPRNRGDLYLASNDRYFLNYSYLCSEFSLSRDQAIAALLTLSKVLEPSAKSFELLGGRTSISALIDESFSLEGDQIPQSLMELLPLIDHPFDELHKHLPKKLVSHLTATAVTRQLGFEFSSQDLIELYELFAIKKATGHSQKLFQGIVDLLFKIVPSNTADPTQPPPEAWRKHWKGLRRRFGIKRLQEVADALLPVYRRFYYMLNEKMTCRIATAWFAASTDTEYSTEWSIDITTAEGLASPIIAASLLHQNMPSAALSSLASSWADRANMVPQQSSWSRSFTVLVLRFAITKQRKWLLERLTDLYLRGGGYEAGETREIIETVLERLLDEMILNDEERAELDAADLHFEILHPEVNIFTGELVDASRWASPTSAYKYLRTILRLDDRGLDYLASLVSERRIISVEKILCHLDFHTSVQQIVACLKAFRNKPAQALSLLLQLRNSTGEQPDEEWINTTQGLLSALSLKDTSALLWTLYQWDNGDEYSLNPGIFWAMRLAPIPSSISQLPKAATEVVRRKPSFAIAILDTLNTISTRGALSSILQMRRKIRNRKVLKLINQTIDDVAKKEGFDRDVFLDYAVDTGELLRDSSRLFDFGSHSVTLRLELDGRLSTNVVDSKGRHLRSFPKSAKDSNSQLYKEFQNTKKLLAETIGYQTRRLEKTMIDARDWSGKNFIAIFSDHPIMAHLGRRLLWGVLGAKGEIRKVLIPTLKGFDDQDGKNVKVDDDATLLILHPLHLSEKERDAWKKYLAKHKIKQPFEQTERGVYKPLPSELETCQIERLIGLKTDSQELYRIVKERNWSTDGGGPWEIGSTTHSYRSYPSAEQRVHLNTDALNYEKEFNILEICFTDNAGKDLLPVEDINPIVYSEAFRDLMHCFRIS